MQSKVPEDASAAYRKQQTLNKIFKFKGQDKVDASIK